MLKIFSFNTSNIIEKINRFEEQNNIKLPSLYADFLKKYNGGYTPKTSFEIDEISSDIRGFYGFEENDENYNFLLLTRCDDFIDCMNNSFLPIAMDSIGNFIVIGIGEHNNGEVYFLDTEMNRYNYLSSNFKNFISQINSQKFIIRSIDERLQGMKKINSNVKVDDELLKLWQTEIDKYSKLKQQIVII
ncbi:SMI1/KNR4 family protein [Orbus wheelerorum]|uniref:SMI1/KNR4 family protein n=1 Tax=Orbus wheelerorum TaxID=3074111 RepID=UPI00370DD44D